MSHYYFANRDGFGNEVVYVRVWVGNAYEYEVHFVSLDKGRVQTDKATEDQKKGMSLQECRKRVASGRWLELSVGQAADLFDLAKKSPHPWPCKIDDTGQLVLTKSSPEAEADARRTNVYTQPAPAPAGPAKSDRPATAVENAW